MVRSFPYIQLVTPIVVVSAVSTSPAIHTRCFATVNITRGKTPFSHLKVGVWRCERFAH